jgi:ribonucleotide reductase alpha subunit
MEYITKRDGSIVEFDMSKVRDALYFAKPAELSDYEFSDFAQSILDNFKTLGCLSTVQLSEKLIDACVILIDSAEPIYDAIARNLLVVDTLKDVYTKTELTRQKIYENFKITSMMSYAGVAMVAATYLQRCKKTKKVIQDFCSWRTLADPKVLGDAYFLKDGSTIDDALQRLLVIGSTPLSKNDHAQTFKERQLASCFITHVGDTTESIFEAAHEIAVNSGLGGGCGLEVTSVRERGHGVRGMPNSGGGVVQTCKIFESIIQLFNQGGARAGSAAVYLSVWHADIMDFLHSQDAGGNHEQRLYRLQIGVNLHDNFMRAVISDDYYYLFSPVNSGLYGLYGTDFEEQYDKAVISGSYIKRVKARDIFAKIVEARIHKYCFIMFIDTVCNVAGQWIGGSNICTEIIGQCNSEQSVVCTLASINLSLCRNDSDIRLASEACIKLLHYNLLSAKAPIKRGRKFNESDQMVGCSFMGLAEYLSVKGFVAGEQEYLDEIGRICTIRQQEIETYINSTNGSFNPIRTTTSPPNESLAIICNTTSSHELPVSNNFTKGLNGKSFPVILSKYTGKYAFDLSMDQQLDIIEVLQKHTDQAISFNTYHTDRKLQQALSYMLDAEINGSDDEAAFARKDIVRISELIRHKFINEVAYSITSAWKRKIKTLYYVRKEDVKIEGNSCESCAG